MTIPLRVLLIEDSDDEARLLLQELRQGGYAPEHECVDTADAMNAALDKQSWDVIISDYVLSQFGGLAALTLLKKRGDDTPLIIVSGTVGEDVAVEALKEGADDYLLKDKLIRLVPAVQRTLGDAEHKRERKRAEEQLSESEEKLRSLIETTKMRIRSWKLKDRKQKLVYRSNEPSEHQ
jgi:hypothetical protein